MTVIQAHLVGDNALVPRGDFDRLVEIARRQEPIDIRLSDDDLPTISMMRLAESSGAFDFWRDSAEDIYSPNDGEPIE